MKKWNQVVMTWDFGPGLQTNIKCGDQPFGYLCKGIVARMATPLGLEQTDARDPRGEMEIFMAFDERLGRYGDREEIRRQIINAAFSARSAEKAEPDRDMSYAVGVKHFFPDKPFCTEAMILAKKMLAEFVGGNNSQQELKRLEVKQITWVLHKREEGKYHWIKLSDHLFRKHVSRS